jgi:hypothetical protein
MNLVMDLKVPADVSQKPRVTALCPPHGDQGDMEDVQPRPPLPRGWGVPRVLARRLEELHPVGASLK